MYRKYFKRIIDFVFAFILLFCTLPVFLLCSIFLLVTNNGKIFFTQERPGKDEFFIKIIKFKTMNDNKDQNGNLLTDKERLFCIGKFLRKTSLDELPQLINVLKGDMAIIGPRPLLIRYLPYYTIEERKRHRIRPGITGLSQISGRNNLTWNERLALDIEYVDKLSFYLDLKIVFKTIVNIILRKDIVIVPNTSMKDLDDERKQNNL